MSPPKEFDPEMLAMNLWRDLSLAGVKCTPAILPKFINAGMLAAYVPQKDLEDRKQEHLETTLALTKCWQLNHELKAEVERLKGSREDAESDALRLGTEACNSALKIEELKAEWGELLDDSFDDMAAVIRAVGKEREAQRLMNEWNDKPKPLMTVEQYNTEKDSLLDSLYKAGVMIGITYRKFEDGK